jgi:hypothetical protein
MVTDILKTIVISLLLIALLHYSYNYLQETLTVPKVKDLVNRPKEKYDSIMKVVNTVPEQTTHQSNTQPNTQQPIPSDGTPIAPATVSSYESPDNMQNELNNYVSEINKQGNLETSAVTNMHQAPIEQINTRQMNSHVSQPVVESSNESTNISSLPTI